MQEQQDVGELDLEALLGDDYSAFAGYPGGAASTS